MAIPAIYAASAILGKLGGLKAITTGLGALSSILGLGSDREERERELKRQALERIAYLGQNFNQAGDQWRRW